MQRRLASYTLILGIACLLTACGFQLRGTGADLPESWKHMYMVTGNPNGEFSQAVRSVFTTNGIVWTDKSDTSYSFILGPERFNQANLSLNNEARVSQYELTLQTTFSVRDPSGAEVMPDTTATVLRQMENDPRNALGMGEELRILRAEMNTELAQQIIRRIGFFLHQQALMRVYPEQLSAALKRQLLPVYLVSGDEPLQLQECSDLVRREARAQGCTDREVIDASPAGFNWQDILHSASSMSLFAERKLLELRLPSGKPGADGSKALCEYLDIAGGEDVLLIIAGKIDKSSTNSKWFKALDKAGAVIQVWPVEARNLPKWLRQRVSAAGMGIDDDALQLLCDRVEGNLLAAVQEVEKLKLLVSDSRITARTVLESVSDNARYTVFELADKALKGDTAASLHTLHGLRGEATEPTVVLWSLSREIRTLYEVQLDCPDGRGIQQALESRRVWKNRVPLMQAALARHDPVSMSRLLEQASNVDGSIKGFAGGRPWDNLEDLVISLCRP